MSYSFNEIEALAKRAARGAGLPWGLAEEAAMAARWLAAFDLPWDALLVDLLGRHEGVELAEVSPNVLGGVSNTEAWFSPLTAGPALSDRADIFVREGWVELAKVTHPALILPFAAAVARQIKSPVSVTWDGVALATDGVGLSVTADPSALDTLDQVNIICTATTHLPDAAAPKSRGQMSDAAMLALSSLAEKSFAPATEASRQLGAGADQNDND